MDTWPRGSLSGTHMGSAREGNPDTPGDARECQSWRREGLRGERQTIPHEIGSDGEC